MFRDVVQLHRNELNNLEEISNAETEVTLDLQHGKTRLRIRLNKEGSDESAAAVDGPKEENTRENSGPWTLSTMTVILILGTCAVLAYRMTGGSFVLLTELGIAFIANLGLLILTKLSSLLKILLRGGLFR